MSRIHRSSETAAARQHAARAASSDPESEDGLDGLMGGSSDPDSGERPRRAPLRGARRAEGAEAAATAARDAGPDDDAGPGPRASRGKRGGPAGDVGQVDEREPRPRTPIAVWVLAALAVAAGIVSLAAAWWPESALNWVWPAGVGVFLGGAAWVLAALSGSRKRWGIAAVLVCALGVTAPLVSAAMERASLQSQAQSLVDDEDAEASLDGYDETAMASVIPTLVAQASGWGQPADVGDAHVVVQKVVGSADAEVKSLDAEAPAAEGRYVTAAVEVSNRGEEALSPGTSLGVDLVFADGSVVDSLACPAMLPQSQVTAADLAPGERETYQVCFDVPKELATDALVNAAAVRVAWSEGSPLDAGYWRVTQ